MRTSAVSEFLMALIILLLVIALFGQNEKMLRLENDLATSTQELRTCQADTRKAFENTPTDSQEELTTACVKWLFNSNLTEAKRRICR